MFLINAHMYFRSKSVIKTFAYEGAQMVPIAHPLICRQFLQLKLKLFRVSISVKNVIMAFMATVFYFRLSSALFVTVFPSEFGCCCKETLSPLWRNILFQELWRYLLFFSGSGLCLLHTTSLTSLFRKRL